MTAPLPKEVEEAMDVLSKLAYNHEMVDPNDDLNFKSEAALAVIKAALTVKPSLTVAPPTRVSIDVIKDILDSLIDDGPLWYRGSMPEEGRAISILSEWFRELGIEVEERP